MHHHRWVVRVSRNVGMHGGAMAQLSRMGGHLGRRVAWLSHVHTHWTTPRHIIPWHTLQPCGEREREKRVVVSGGEWLGGVGSLQPEVGCGVTGTQALWNRESTCGLNRNGFQVKKKNHPQEHPSPSKHRVFWR